ncbi:MAG: hypothetical protein ACYC1L_07005 [Alphaproteobacteria bacterium]
MKKFRSMRTEAFKENLRLAWRLGSTYRKTGATKQIAEQFVADLLQNFCAQHWADHSERLIRAYWLGYEGHPASKIK